MAYATVFDVAIYVPDLDADLDVDLAELVETLIEQAEAQILVEFPDLVERVARGDTNLVLLKRVEAEMVSSVMRNRNGYASESIGIGSLSRSHSMNLNVAAGVMTLTAAQRILIRGTAGGQRGGVYTISLGGNPPRPFEGAGGVWPWH